MAFIFNVELENIVPWKFNFLKFKLLPEKFIPANGIPEKSNSVIFIPS